MHTGRKYLIAGAAFSLLLLLSAAMTMVSAQRITAEKPKEKEQLPSLTLVYEAERVTAACDGYEWEFMDGSIEVSDARHPLDAALRMPSIIRRADEGRIRLIFSEKPRMVEIRRWELSERGNYDARAVTRSITDNWISVPSEGSYIYEVKASWPRGEISYVFEFGLAPEDIRLELGDLPANYTVDTAVTSGDVVIAP